MFQLRYTLFQKKRNFNLSFFPGDPGSVTLTTLICLFSRAPISCTRIHVRVPLISQSLHVCPPNFGQWAPLHFPWCPWVTDPDTLLQKKDNFKNVAFLLEKSVRVMLKIMKPTKNSTSATFILFWYVLHCTGHFFWIVGSETFETMKLGHQSGCSFFMTILSHFGFIIFSMTRN